ncbi:MAG: hypothetical protein ACERKO_13500, partial [Acetanaerobacterium sp.]
AGQSNDFYATACDVYYVIMRKKQTRLSEKISMINRQGDTSFIRHLFCILKAHSIHHILTKFVILQAPL